MKKLKNNKNELIIYQSKTGRIEFRGDLKKETIWGSLNQIAELFGRDKSVISRHIKNIFGSNELKKNSTVAKIATVQREGKREIIREIEYFNLDMILSIGYRVDSKQATQFRIWATKTLKQHLLEGYTINKKQLVKNYQKFKKTLKDIQALLPESKSIPAKDALELISVFADTWFSLEAYDSERFPKNGWTKKQAFFTSEELNKALSKLKQELVSKKQATNLFGQEKSKDVVAGIVGNVFQSFGNQDLYPTIEEKSAHLLYFIVKNHPFTDGNKRSGAFAFVWFLRKTSQLPMSLTPEALTALTLLIAESNPKDKDKMIGLVLLLLQKRKKTR